MAETDYEILVMMSDEHSGQTCGFAGDPVVRTPNLDRLARQGTVFTNAYTMCPLCVPARAGFMTCRYPFDIGVGDNHNAYSSLEPTFAHCLGIAGYETVLCGRMHFRGLDQRHGFEKRIAKDITPVYPGLVFTGEKTLQKSYRGARMHGIYPEAECVSLHYDRYVAENAVQYLQKEHEKKQAMVVGTYMPHMPLGAGEDKVNYYRDKVMQTLKNDRLNYPCDYLFTGASFVPEEREAMVECRAAYYAMIETEDELVGKVYGAFRSYLDRKGAKGIFIYLSDHGDHMGEKSLLGKRTFFEHSAKIPLVVVADGWGHQVVDTPVSLLDVGETLCALAKAPRLPHSEGMDLSPALRGEEIPCRPIISEVFGKGKERGELALGTMVRSGPYKLVTYQGFEEEDLLFNLEKDPEEEENCIAQNPDVARRLKQIAAEHTKDSAYKIRRLLENTEGSANAALLKEWGMQHPHINDADLWIDA